MSLNGTVWFYNAGMLLRPDFTVKNHGIKSMVHFAVGALVVQWVELWPTDQTWGNCNL